MEIFGYICKNINEFYLDSKVWFFFFENKLYISEFFLKIGYFKYVCVVEFWRVLFFDVKCKIGIEKYLKYICRLINWVFIL